LAIEILVHLSSPLLSPESSPWSSPESRFCSVPSTSYLARVHTSHCHLWYWQWSKSFYDYHRWVC